MKKLFLIHLLLLIHGFILAQSGQERSRVYVHYSDTTDYFKYSWIEFFEDGRFEIGNADLELTEVTHAGRFTETNENFNLFEFAKRNSNYELLEKEHNGFHVVNEVNVTVCDERGNPIQGINVFAHAFSDDHQNFNEKAQTDSVGSHTFYLQKNMMLNKITVGSIPEYQLFELDFIPVENKNYAIKIFLEKDPILNRSYSGKLIEHPMAILVKVDEKTVEWNRTKYSIQ